MSNVAITAEALGKRYRIGAPTLRPRSLKEVLESSLTAPRRNWQRVRRLSTFDDNDERDVIWALRNVSFELKHGDALGVIGGNGAGKSTLLKILSRITRPTTGRARTVGRVGSLLEVGTGFHPELTGRDNVYLNGSILGMSRAEIARRFDEIVEFAGVARFIDTPVKRYSSGMYLRLAFSVAAHLDPDVLIVDEVLAVGDLEFQRKCLRQMDEVAHEGRTVLFVSHNLGAIQRLCTRAILLQRGEVVAEGDTSAVVKRYLATGDTDAPPARWLDLTSLQRCGTGVVRFEAMKYGSMDAAVDFRPYPGGALEVVVKVFASKSVPPVTLALALSDQYGTTLINIDTDVIGFNPSLPKGPSAWRFVISRLYLKPGTYHLLLGVGDSMGIIHDRLDPALRLNVYDLQGPAAGAEVDHWRDGLVVCNCDVAQVDEQEWPTETMSTSAAG